MQLTNGQIKRLRAEGHRLKLKPVVIIGQKGLSENLHREIDAALDHHELLKLRIPALYAFRRWIRSPDAKSAHRFATATRRFW